MIFRMILNLKNWRRKFWLKSVTFCLDKQWRCFFLSGTGLGLLNVPFVKQYSKIAQKMSPHNCARTSPEMTFFIRPSQIFYSRIHKFLPQWSTVFFHTDFSYTVHNLSHIILIFGQNELSDLPSHARCAENCG